MEESPNKLTVTFSNFRVAGKSVKYKVSQFAVGEAATLTNEELKNLIIPYLNWLKTVPMVEKTVTIAFEITQGL